MKKSSEKRSRRHIWIDDADWEFITEYYGDSIGVSGAIQVMIKAFLTKVKEGAAKKGRSLSGADLDLPESP